MIYTNRKVTVRNGVSTIDAPIILYRGDKEVDIKFEIIDIQFKFRGNNGNLIDNAKASFGQLAIQNPDGYDTFTEIAACEDGQVVFRITGEMIDEIYEVGMYSFHIRLFDEDQTSRITIPHVQNGIEIKEPLVIEDRPSDIIRTTPIGFINDNGPNSIHMYGFNGDSYILKYEDDNEVLEAFHDIGYLNSRTLSNDKIIYQNNDLIMHNIAPYSATKIGVYDDNGVKKVEIPLENFKPAYGERLYRFGLLSDVHNNAGAGSGSENQNAESREDFERALKLFNDKESVWATCITGDLTDTGAEDQLQIYKNNVDTNSPNTPVYACAGNHDCRSSVSDAIWEQYTGNPRCFEITKGNDHFLFFGMSKESMGPNGKPYDETNIDWLADKLDEYRNERCFVFMHLFFPDRAGNLKRLYTSNNWLGGTQLTRIQGLCDHYANSIWFSGHSHWKWSSQMYEQKANIWKSDISGWCVHVPSCAVPKFIANADAGTSYSPLDSEGAIVDVYDDYIDIRAIDLKNNKYIPIAQYRLDTTLVSVASNKTIDDVMDELLWFDAYLDSSTGQVSTAQSGYSTSCYTPYVNTKVYTLNLDSSVEASRVFYYDGNKTFISCTAQLTAGDHELLPPNNTTYIRVRCRRVGISNDDVYNHVSLVVTEKPIEGFSTDLLQTYEVKLNQRWSASSNGYVDEDGQIALTIPYSEIKYRTLRLIGFTKDSGDGSAWYAYDSSGALLGRIAATGTGVVWNSSALIDNGDGTYDILMNKELFVANNKPITTEPTTIRISMRVDNSSITSFDGCRILVIE